MEIPIPYNLKPDEVKLEPRAHEWTMDEEMGWLNDHISWSDEPAMERIFRSTVILHHKFPDRPLGECLHTALVWEVG